MNEKSLTIKIENSKTISQRKNTAKQLNKGKESRSCGSCNACNRLRNPQVSSKGVSSALSYAKAVGKESCALSFMQSNYGNRFTAGVLSPTIQKKCSCGGSCPECKGEEEAERISTSIMRMESPLTNLQPSVCSRQPSFNNKEQTQKIPKIILLPSMGA